MRVENAGIFCADRLGDTLLHFEDLRASGNESALETNDFVGNIRFINSPFRRFFVVGVVDKNDTAGNPWTYTKPLKSYFLTAHSGLIPHRTVFRSAVRVPESPFRHQHPQPIKAVLFPDRRQASLVP